MRTKLLLTGLLVLIIATVAAASAVIGMPPGTSAGSQSGQGKPEPKLRSPNLLLWLPQGSQYRDKMKLHRMKRVSMIGH